MEHKTTWDKKTIWDNNGNRLGEDVITTDRDGRTHITHYDARRTFL